MIPLQYQNNLKKNYHEQFTLHHSRNTNYFMGYRLLRLQRWCYYTHIIGYSRNSYNSKINTRKKDLTIKN